MIVDVVLIVAVAVAFFSLGWCVTLNHRLHRVEQWLQSPHRLLMSANGQFLQTDLRSNPCAKEPAGKPESSKPHGAAVQFEDYR